MRYRNFDGLIPDAPELIHTYLEGEQDASCKRNAFIMLIHVDRVSYGIPVVAGRELILLTNRIGLWNTSLRVLTRSMSSMIFCSWSLWS